MADSKSVLAMDVGEARIGVALASLASRLPQPLTTLLWEEGFFDRLRQIIETEAVVALVVGLPRSLGGEDTSQTRAVKDFVEQLKQHFTLPVQFQDEAVTSRRAQEELEARNKPYKKSDIDALAATYILEDWLTENKDI
jgi:putative Holliday junction resolvase